LAFATVLGCANLSVGGDGGTSGSAGHGGSCGSLAIPITVACSNSENFQTYFLPWELRVSTLPSPLDREEEFAAYLGGVAVLDEFFLDRLQSWVEGAEEINLVELTATVHVRSGASGPDMKLSWDADPELYPYECSLPPRTPCNPNNDLEGVPGVRGNTDCQPAADFNPCGRFVPLPISHDCDAGGTCADRGKVGLATQCAQYEFCVTGDLELELSGRPVTYKANADDEVLFGWADESTGATVRETDPDAGSWVLPEANYDELTGPLGLRLVVGTSQVAVECTMGVDCQGDDGPDPPCTTAGLSSRTPDSALISVPVER